MVADQTLDRLAAHQVGDEGTHVAALGDIAVVAEAAHQLRPRACGAGGLPAELGRLAREAVARQGRQHQVEGVLGGAAVGGRVGQRADGLEELDDRAGPAVGHDQRQRVLVTRLDVDEVDVDPVDGGRELRQRIQLGLALAPVVVGGPVAGERLHRGRLHALGPIVHQLLAGPARRGDAPPKVVQCLVRNVDLERADLVGALDGGAHGRPPLLVGAPINAVTGTEGSRRSPPATSDGAAATVMPSRPPRGWRPL